jgi:hypothetical protein
LTDTTSPRDTVQLKAEATYEDTRKRDVTRTVRWTSGSSRVARVSNEPKDKGVVTAGSAAAKTTITAILPTINGTLEIEVKRQ